VTRRAWYKNLWKKIDMCIDIPALVIPKKRNFHHIKQEIGIGTTKIFFKVEKHKNNGFETMRTFSV